MIPIKHPKLEELAMRHWNVIKNYASSGRKKYNVKHFDTTIQKFFPKENFESIVLAKHEKIKDLATIWNNSYKGEKTQCFLTYYGYLTDGKLGDYSSIDIVEGLGISVCPYCNRNFIKNTTTRRIDELDHFYPKDDYPFLALSFYNLIPSCKTCNQTFKKENIISINPYDLDTLNNTFHFKLEIKSVNFYHDSENGFELDFTEIKNKLQENFTVFEIENLYNQHKDVILELIQKQVTYSDDYIDDLFKRYEGTLFKNREDVLRHIGGNYVSEENFHKRPLSKLTHDIAEDLGFI